MDFSSRREQSIETAKKQLRQPLDDDRIIIYAYKYNNKIPLALENWLFEIMPHLPAQKAKELVVKNKKNAWDPKGIGSNMSDMGWELLLLACQNKKLDLEEICKKHTPNLHALLGSEYTAKLLYHAGGLEKLSRLTQRDLISLGCNKLGRGKESILQTHELATTDRALRILCSRTILAARLDLYKGIFKGDSLRQEVLYAQ